MNELLFTPNLSVKSAKFLIASGADINTKDNNNLTPLQHACNKNNFDLVKLFIENGADKKNIVICNTSDEIKSYLVKAGCPANRTLIMLFGTEEQKANYKINLDELIHDFNIENLKTFVAFNDINTRIKNQQNRSLLHYAVEWERLECVKFLVENGADIFIKDDDGVIPVMLNYNTKIYSLLKESIDETNDDGNTSLHYHAELKEEYKIKNILLKLELELI